MVMTTGMVASLSANILLVGAILMIYFRVPEVKDLFMSRMFNKPIGFIAKRGKLIMKNVNVEDDTRSIEIDDNKFERVPGCSLNFNGIEAYVGYKDFGRLFNPVMARVGMEGNDGKYAQNVGDPEAEKGIDIPRNAFIRVEDIKKAFHLDMARQWIDGIQEEAKRQGEAGPQDSGFNWSALKWAAVILIGGALAYYIYQMAKSKGNPIPGAGSLGMFKIAISQL